jgi:hypothetical protein
MRLLVLLVIVFGHCLSLAGEWTQVDGETIKLTGSIEPDEYARFAAVFNSRIKKLIVNSGGGETSAALQIATDLFHASVEISVEGRCISSCANYLFTAAAKKVLNKGVVGFHGNTKACFTGKKWEERAKKFLNAGLTQDQVDEVYQDIQETIKVEEQFLAMVGVSQEIFDITCTDEKGMSDGKSYSVLLPLPATFERFGIFNVTGTQDLDQVKSWNPPAAIW